MVSFIRPCLLIIAILTLTACGAFRTGDPIATETAAVATPSPTSLTTIAGKGAEPEIVGDAPIAPTAAPVPAQSDEAVQNEATELEDALVGVYRQSNPAVVYIEAAGLGSGSGFVYDETGHIITNHHVVAGAQAYEIIFADGTRRFAELIGSDADADLAVLKVESLPPGVTPLPLAAPESVQVGQLVVAIGNPFGEQGSMSLGIVSGVGRSLPSQRAQNSGSTYALPQVIQTDAPINPGNSGGPLLNLDGEVIGVNAAIASTTGTNSGVGFSIPVAAVMRIVPILISDGTYTYSYMGIGFDNELSLRERDAFNLTDAAGIYVITVAPDSPAEEAGLIAANLNTGQGGDLVTAIDGQPITNFAELNSYLVFSTEPGQTIELTVLRDGETLILPLQLGARP